jgi:hypothetical protein
VNAMNVFYNIMFSILFIVLFFSTLIKYLVMGYKIKHFVPEPDEEDSVDPTQPSSEKDIA